MNASEAEIILRIQQISSPFLDAFFNAVTVLGSLFAVFISFAVILMFFGAKKTAKYGVILTIAALLCQVIKFTVKRQRPFNYSDLIIDKTIDFTGSFSFPSAHVTVAFVTALFLSACVLRSVRNIWAKIGVIAVFTLLVMLVGFSRVYLGVHYISDIVAGIVIGAVIYAIIDSVFEAVYKKIIAHYCGRKSRNSFAFRRNGSGEDDPCVRGGK